MAKKLTITPCDIDDKGNITGARKSESIEVMLNPSGYTHGYEVCYNNQMALGQSSPQPKYKNSGKEKVNFDIVIDGTGVVPVPDSEKGIDVKTRVNSLNDTVYRYVGTHHQPNTLQLLWGSLLFYGRLSSMSVEYTLFKPSGEPLRAKVKLAFVGYVSSTEEALKANKSSPDLSHIVDVKAGDSLPLLCFRIYKNSAYYLEVAKSNGITNFRDIRPGTKLRFPPLR